MIKGRRPVADFRYTYSKLSDSVGILVTHQGTLRERIIFAFAPFITISRQDFPDELGQKFDDLMQRATRYSAEATEGDIAATVREMSDDDVASLVREIHELEYLMRDVVRDLD